MNRLITSHYSLLAMFHWQLYFILTALALGFVALPQRAQAVSPAPDGGYPGGNTAEGQTALLSLTTGGFNTAVGYLSLRSNTGGSYNTAVGAGTLFANTNDLNTAIGAGALLSNSTGNANTANGGLALSYNTTGYSNVASGATALVNNTTGHQNTASGASALFSNTEGNSNVADGINALSSNTSGSANTAVGGTALAGNTGGNNNTAIGYAALAGNTGSLNTAMGVNAGNALTTGENNIDIGANVMGVAAESNTIRIGNTDITDSFIRGISGATSSGGAAVFVNGNGKLGTMTSSARYKEGIRPMDKASEAVFSLKPVRFRYRKEIDPQRIAQFGLVAEDVEKVNADLVIRDAEGRPQTVRYEQINAMLLNEFLKEHRACLQEQRKVQQLEANGAEQQKEITLLRSELKEQRALIQKVNDKVDLKQSASQIVATD